MTTNTSSTAAATSDVASRLGQAVQSAESRMSPERLEHLKEVKAKADGLSDRGLLRQPGYSAAQPAQLEKMYTFTKI